jgi:hypothetical protein
MDETPVAQSQRPDSRAARVWLASLAGAFALLLYARTLAPGLTWAHNGADGGDLLAAALTRGVPHPPGYPTFMLLLRTSIALAPNNPARAGNWLSAVCAALAVGLLAGLACRMLRGQGQESTLLGGRHRAAWREVLALGAALAWAASPALWSQAVITEVYTLNALTVVALLWLLWGWRQSNRQGRGAGLWPAAAGLTFGAGLGDHLSLVLLLPAIAAWFWQIGKLRQKNSALSGERRGLGQFLPTRWWLFAVATVAGLGVYAYLPWAAASNPPVNWGNPDSLSRFWWTVSGQLYHPLAFALEPGWLPLRLAAWAGEALRQFGPWGAAFAVAGLWRLETRDRALWWLTVVIALVYSVFSIGYNTADSYVYLLPVWAVMDLWLAQGLAAGFEFLEGALQRTRTIDRRRQSYGLAVRALPALAIVVTLLLPALSIVRFGPSMDLSHDQTAQAFAAQVAAEAQPGGVILTAGDETTFALWYMIYGLRIRPDLAPLNVNLYGFDWYRATLASHHPTLSGVESDPPLEEFLPGVAARHPLYSTEDLGITLPGLVGQPVGDLVRLLSMKQ